MGPAGAAARPGSGPGRPRRRFCTAGAVLGALATAFLAGCGEKDSEVPIPPPPAPAETVPAPTRPRDRADLAARTRETLAGLKADPASTELRARFLFLFLEILEVDAEGPGSGTGFAGAYRTAFDFALAGDGDCLIALMRGARKVYPRSIAAWEGINGMLWRILEEQPQLTLDALAALPEGERTEIIGWEYLHPVHDRFDFPRILEGLEAARTPPGMEHDVGKIEEVVRSKAPD